MRSRATQKGFTLVEVVIATSIILAFLITLLGAYALYLKISFSNLRKVQATFLVEETLEAVRSMRDDSWDLSMELLALNTPHYISFSGGKWATTTSATPLDGIFYRYFTVAEVHRDLSSNISENGPDLDLNTKKITATVEWATDSGTSTKSVSMYLSRIFDEE